MTNDKARFLLSFAVVGVFLVSFMITVFAGVIGYMDVETTKELIKSLFSPFSGIIGVIFGYYFFRKRN